MTSSQKQTPQTFTYAAEIRKSDLEDVLERAMLPVKNEAIRQGRNGFIITPELGVLDYQINLKYSHESDNLPGLIVKAAALEFKHQGITYFTLRSNSADEWMGEGNLSKLFPVYLRANNALEENGMRKGDTLAFYRENLTDSAALDSWKDLFFSVMLNPGWRFAEAYETFRKSLEPPAPVIQYVEKPAPYLTRDSVSLPRSKPLILPPSASSQVSSPVSISALSKLRPLPLTIPIPRIGNPPQAVMPRLGMKLPESGIILPPSVPVPEIVPPAITPERKLIPQLPGELDPKSPTGLPSLGKLTSLAPKETVPGKQVVIPSAIA